MSNQQNHYDTLGVPQFASLDECKKAWRTKTFSQHPDLFKDEADKARQSEIIKELNKAWYVLGDAHRKTEYDNHLIARHDLVPPEPVKEEKKWTFGNIVMTVLAVIALIRVGAWLLKYIIRFFIPEY